MATRLRAKHQKAKRKLQYAAQDSFFSPRVNVHYFDMDDLRRLTRPCTDDEDDPDYDYESDPDYEPDCMTCGGDGWMSAQEAECDWINYGQDEIARCPNCKGSGLAKDQCFW